MSVPFCPRCRADSWARRSALIVAFLLGLLLLIPSARAQAPLHLANDSTSVSNISFRYVDTKTFPPERLRKQLSTSAPGLFTGLRNRFAFLPGLTRRSFFFNPIELQKDVVRLRQFYQQHGFPTTNIDYPATQLDTASNEIHVIFTIEEGPPLTIRERTFETFDEQEPFESQLEASLREKWASFLDQLDIQTGERYTNFKKQTLESNVRTWLQDQGFAFARVQSNAYINIEATTAALQVRIDSGPLTHVSKILVDGNESVSKDIIRRELPFAVGDRFSASEVNTGQQRLFDLNLFRVALADIPDQPQDSTVTVRYRVREANLRAYSAEVGYGTQSGVNLEGSWSHRNFQGDARTFVVKGIADTGYPENPPAFLPSFLARSATQDLRRRFRASVRLQQPYLLTDRLSGSVEPFVQERINPNIGTDPTRVLGLSERQFGLNTRLSYEILPRRPLSLQHSFARVQQFRSPTGDGALTGSDDLFDRSIFSLDGTFGKVDDFTDPSKGVLVRPSLQVSGLLLKSGVNFVRPSGNLSGYYPVSDQVQVAGRLSGGVLFPFGNSRSNLRTSSSPSPAQSQRTQTFQDRFSEHLLYAGGNSNVRGWPARLAGGKVLRRSDIAGTDFVYRPIGARLKVGINLETRLPFPGLGSNWRTAVFIDGAYLEADPLTLAPPPNTSDAVEGPNGEVIQSSSSRVLVGTGAGIRYKTPFGFLRLDLALKITPDELDLRRPGALGDVVDSGATDPVAATPTRTIRRFRLHFGIGRSF